VKVGEKKNRRWLGRRRKNEDPEKVSSKAVTWIVSRGM
jgi:hypothetical protein